MSTKVYNAYRLGKRVHLPDLVRAIQIQGTENVTRVLDNCHLQWMQSIQKSSPKYTELSAQHREDNYTDLQVDTLVRSNIAMDIMEEGYQESVQKHMRSPFDFDVSVTFRELNGYWYAQLFADMCMHRVLDFVTEWPGVKDYHYQNQTDRPHEVTMQEWAERRRVWDKLYKTDIDRKTFLSCVVMDIREFPYWSWRRAQSVVQSVIDNKL